MVKKKIAAKKKTRKRRSNRKGLSAKELKKYKALLIKEREKVGGDISHLTSETLNKSQREASGDLSGYSYHMADMASDDYDRDFSLGRATAEQKVLYAIDEALKRIQDKSYGFCLGCGKAITVSRLTALPQTELCIECQKKREER